MFTNYDIQATCVYKYNLLKLILKPVIVLCVYVTENNV